MSKEIDYIQAGVEAEEKLLDIYKDNDGWTETKKTEVITVYSKKSTEFAGNIYKSIAIIDGTRDVAFHVWLPNPKGTRIEWDSQLELCDIIKEFDDNTVIMRSVCKSFAMGMISSREFCDIVKLSQNDDTQTNSSSCFSIEYPDCPIQSKYVRGKNYASGAFFRTLSDDENKCEVTYIIQSDIGGMLPRTLVESAIPGNIVKTLEMFKSAVASKRS